METNKLKKFAQEARVKLLQQIEGRLNYVLHNKNTSTELLGKAQAVKALEKAISSSNLGTVVEKTAYTWFNRLIALRFMDANGYQPLGIKVVSSATGNSHIPELLDEVNSGRISSRLKVDEKLVLDILDGRVASTNPDNEVYRMLLVAACNGLHEIFPFLFEEINDYTELLLPADLTSDKSVIYDVVQGMDDESCAEVEIIGWLYQFYVSEKNAALINSKKVYERDELAPASQLFTPKWIVQYMVDNTLGHLWWDSQSRSTVHESLEYFILPNRKRSEGQNKPVEDIKFFEPCVGSGHILCYAFDVFYAMYEEEGYSPNEIPELILTKNLWGVDIDERAAQMASFVLMMKARSKSRRFFKKSIQPNIYSYKDYSSDNKFNNAMALGSLIRVEPNEVEDVKVDDSSLFGDEQNELKGLYNLLGQRYDVVVTNPPYISSSRMEGSVKQFVLKHYPEAKSDLFAAFIIRCLELTEPGGYTGYMTPFVWMFISSYEKLRESFINEYFINNLVQLEYSGFDGATVPICTFTLRNEPTEHEKGNYIRLSDFKGSKVQGPKTLEAIQNPDCGWFYRANQKDFLKIPGGPVGYWLSSITTSIFEDSDQMHNKAKARQGISTADNDRFIRLWYEVEFSKIRVNNDSQKWVPHNKGGEFRKWYGNQLYLINWADEGFEIKNFFNKQGKRRSVIRNPKYYFNPSVSWSDVTSSKNAFRVFQQGFIHNGCAPSAFGGDEEFRNCLAAYGNLNYISELVKIINPTMHFSEGYFSKLPFTSKFWIPETSQLSEKCISIARKEWDNQEISWDFRVNSIVQTQHDLLEDSLEFYKQFWKNKFFELHRAEVDLNKLFNNIYGLDGEVEYSVPLSEITILKKESRIEGTDLIFIDKEILSQLISYSVGCMFGRYALEKEGLIIANHGETIQDYLTQVGKSESEISFLPDNDNIIPVLDDEWFEDDIVGRFHEFLKASFGEKNFVKNLQFVEDCLGKDVRKYLAKDFYNDHNKRYKKRPIYWMFSSQKGHFKVLVYLHRYTPDTLSQILNNYLREFMSKLSSEKERQQDIVVTGAPREQAKALKEIDKIEKQIDDCLEYEAILRELALERIELDLDDGVLVNYNKMGKAVATVPGLNDAITKKKVRGFDWIDTTQIR